MRVSQRWPDAMRRPPPAAFAFVMATGIVAIAARQQGLSAIALAALAIAAVAWVVLVLANAARMAGDRAALASQWRDHAVAPGFFTAVAATGVFAGNLAGSEATRAAAFVLASLTALLWLLITYGIFAALTTRAGKPPLARGLNGSWLLAVVATQSVAVVGALLAPYEPPALRLEMNFAALCMWLFAGMLYTWIIVLIFYRYLFLRFEPADFTPPYWINMGAMAISTLAGSLLASHAAEAPFLHSLLPVVEGVTLLYWATATWWLPMLVALAFWRHAVRREPLRADAIDWSIVFPLGMYSAATNEMAGALHLPFLSTLAAVFCALAIVAWVATAAARVRGLLSRS